MVGNYVTAGVGNYVTDNPSNLGKYVTADSRRRVLADRHVWRCQLDAHLARGRPWGDPGGSKAAAGSGLELSREEAARFFRAVPGTFVGRHRWRSGCQSLLLGWSASARELVNDPAAARS